jgi:DNA adenine methylase
MMVMIVVKCTKKKLKTPVKVQRSKAGLSNWIIDNFPLDYDNLTFVNPMCSDASVILNKKKSKEEIINGIDHNLMCIFKSLRDEPKEFFDKIKKIKINEKSFKMAQAKSESGIDDYVDKGINEFILRRFSKSGLKKSFYAGSSTWSKIIKELTLIPERINKCTILNIPIFEVLKVWDEENTLWYLDPPSVPSIKEEKNKFSEMSIDDHIQLISFAKNSRGKVIISGNSSTLYNRSLKGWKVKRKNTSKSKKNGKIEVLWMNY